MTTRTEILDGRRDFDFLYGKWQVRNRKLTDIFDPTCTDWVEFDARIEAHPILGGLGNVDTFEAPELPGRGHFHGATLRLFDPNENVWRIWWLAPSMSGQLEDPMVGRFDGTAGTFYGDEPGEIKVRFDWTAGEQDIRWEQLLSFDGEATWQSTWVMECSRIG